MLISPPSIVPPANVLCTSSRVVVSIVATDIDGPEIDTSSPITSLLYVNVAPFVVMAIIGSP